MVSAPRSSSGRTYSSTRARVAPPDQFPSFDLVDEPRAGLLHHLDVRPVLIEQPGKLDARQCLGRGQHADHAGLRRRCRRLQGRFHADDRQLKARAQQVNGHSRGRVTGDDDGFGMPADQKLGDGGRSLFDEGVRSLAVRGVCGIGHIQQILAGERLPDLSKHGQAADTGIEHANGVSQRPFQNTPGGQRCTGGVNLLTSAHDVDS